MDDAFELSLLSLSVVTCLGEERLAASTATWWTAARISSVFTEDVEAAANNPRVIPQVTKYIKELNAGWQPMEPMAMALRQHPISQIS